MRVLKKFIVSHQGRLRGHRLFSLVGSTRSAAFLPRMARAFVWWPMMVQDVLRLNVEKARGSDYEGFVAFHREEGSGHDRWFLHDLHALGEEVPDLGELFGAEFQPLRDACYALLVETHRCKSGAEHLALLLALDTSARVFFEEMSAAVERLCPELRLRYFARSAVDDAYDHVTEATGPDLDRWVLSEADRLRAEETAARTCDLVTDVFSYLADYVQGVARPRTDVRELQNATELPSVHLGGS